MTYGAAPGIMVSGLSFRYAGRRGARDARAGHPDGPPPESLKTLRDVSLTVPSGAVAAVVGPNGSGKSTLLRTISAYLRPSAGTVLLNGLNPFSLTPSERSRLVTYCGDEPDPVFDFTVEETVEMGRLSGGAPFAEQAMRQVGVLGLRDRAITSLSSGERQRVYIARAICQDPDVLLLDEPTAHLDMAYELRVMDLVVRLARERSKTILAVVHDLNLALRYASVMLFMKDGAIVHVLEPAAVTAGVVREVYGVDVWLTVNPAIGCPVVLPVAPE